MQKEYHSQHVPWEGRQENPGLKKGELVEVVVNMELQLPKLQEGWAFGWSVLQRVGMTVLALESQHDNHEM